MLVCCPPVAVAPVDGGRGGANRKGAFEGVPTCAFFYCVLYSNT